MNLEESVKKHTEWKLKFRAAIAGQEQMDVGTIGRDNACPLGQWLHGDGKATCGSRPEFQRAFDAHRKFHVEAGKVASLINAKKYGEAERLIDSDTDYATASQVVGVALMALKKAAKL
jgi:Chemoreceptor zinc-binding domain